MGRRVSLPPPVCDTNLLHLREASFSSYLNHAEKEFVRKLAESTRDRSNSVTTQEDEDGDIEVFGAEKYFIAGAFDDTQKPLKFPPKKPQKRILRSKKPRTSTSSTTTTRSGSPSVRSQSSWNSQKALLQSSTVNTDSMSSKATKKSKSSQLAKGFLYRCYCCDKNLTKSKSNPKRRQTTNAGSNFTFESSVPADLMPKNSASALKMQIQVEEQQGQKPIEVFESSLPNVDSLNVNHLEKRLSTMTWNDIVPKVKDSSNSNSNKCSLIYNDDAESDASSDLFEIETLTGNPNSFLTRQPSDCTDCVTPTTCYAPSEASIEWSVITASAADFSDEHRLSTTSHDVKASLRRRSNHLIGCKNEKAVRVAGDKYGSPEEVQRRWESFGRLTRFEAQRLAANSVPRQYSPKISNILYV
ncbi:protein PHYTOCHROME KINASE SUBSTRATE 1-like [Cucurbita maxima]|uniref:Protein PHYTOCHROME KINASE SUBSTRATE 1-like n=1 Tax=Cucurbita maxima TaxID=3661 RepID=A0A6J1JEI9_CUCMA|nr:protein PHYTOCHROME KINASE SUBSTRATE 1-like [Cucurbita maxima]